MATTTSTPSALSTVSQVAAAGASAGYWTIRKGRTNEYNGEVTHVDIESPAGHRFYICGPNYSKKGTIGIGLDTLGERGGLCVDFSDCHRYGTARPTAREAQTKSPEAIAKGLNRRIVANPEVLASCELMAQRYASMKAQRAALMGHLEKLAALGFDVREPNAKDYHTATATKYDRAAGNGVTVAVFPDGRVTFEATTTVDNLAAVLAAL
jgi:hypothetical protein